MTAAGTVFSVYYLLIVPIGIGFLSHAYRHFFQAPLELPSGSEFTSAFGRTTDMAGLAASPTRS
ncbi:hypothetical protein FFI89_020720 [Bradyrhizobium sp. KBS0727]|jgi:hypothetical protein|uniref:hypothetical protein n=1 Tax=unclassified Bradyrhizobium TaxID=2631580 RepID=UPI00110D5336|nr:MULTISPECIES: hypothetical protein [unclassified Bradyrhizobium]QDW39360.1 hypothetical protein FFI71_020725 [Bradyrhizobium sp. KBS0725]QDW45963.1 hypothetical protein FFI89_020720 [Bradyrhizobium sp. KBS0727]